MTEACEMIVALAQELKIACQLKFVEGICTEAHCGNCHIPELLAEAGRIAGAECETDIPVRMARCGSEAKTDG